MTFKQWISSWLEEHRPIGQLAKAVHGDAEFPETDSYEAMIYHIEKVRDADDACVEVFNRVYKRYKRDMQRKYKDQS